jgi:hypothetical protein
MRQNPGLIVVGSVMASSGVGVADQQCSQVNDIRAPKANRESLAANHAYRGSEEYRSRSNGRANERGLSNPRTELRGYEQ